MTFIGTQKILQETVLKDDFVEVVLEAKKERVPQSNPPEYVKASGLPDTEKVVYNSSDLKKIKTLFENSDATSIRSIRCEAVIAEVLLSLYSHCVKNSDLQYIFQSVTASLTKADTTRMRRLTTIHEDNASVYDLKEELIG